VNKLCVGLRFSEEGGGAGSVLLMATHMSYKNLILQRAHRTKLPVCRTSDT
jgi:hypothetical protein